MSTPRLRRILRALRQKEPTDLPITYRTRPLKGDDGLLYVYDDKYRIILNEKLSVALKVETLLHEYAHALAFPKQSEKLKSEHDSIWGKEYARVWRAYLTLFEGDNEQ